MLKRNVGKEMVGANVVKSQQDHLNKCNREVLERSVHKYRERMLS